MIAPQNNGNALGLCLHRMATAVQSGVIREVQLVTVVMEEWIREKSNVSLQLTRAHHLLIDAQAINKSTKFSRNPTSVVKLA